MPKQEVLYIARSYVFFFFFTSWEASGAFADCGDSQPAVIVLLTVYDVTQSLLFSKPRSCRFITFPFQKELWISFLENAQLARSLACSTFRGNWCHLCRSLQWQFLHLKVFIETKANNSVVAWTNILRKADNFPQPDICILCGKTRTTAQCEASSVHVAFFVMSETNSIRTRPNSKLFIKINKLSENPLSCAAVCKNAIEFESLLLLFLLWDFCR